MCSIEAFFADFGITGLTDKYIGFAVSRADNL